MNGIVNIYFLNIVALRELMIGFNTDMTSHQKKYLTAALFVTIISNILYRLPVQGIFINS